MDCLPSSGLRFASCAAALLVTLAVGQEALAASVPAHDPLDIVIVGDEVNPHGLSPAELTQPNDIAAALEGTGSGLNINSLTNVESSCVDDAITQLQSGADVFIYFAHRAAGQCGGGDGQAALTDAVKQHLLDGGGVVVFHHGIYTAGGKQPILELLGGTAGQIAWDTGSGQDVINVAPEHFITSNNVDYSGMRSFGDAGFNVAQGDYPMFNNNPDERYPGATMLTQGDENRTVLFASDYSGAQLLGYDLHRPEWGGHVVFYQPGEYQPDALDDTEGNNFQILANAIYYAATTQERPSDPSTGGDETGGETGDPETTGTPETTGPATDSDDSSDDTGNDADTAASATMTTTPAPDTDGDTDGSAADESSGSSCSVGGSPAWPSLLALWGVVGLLRRRRASGG